MYMGQVASPSFAPSTAPLAPSIWDNLSTIIGGGFQIYNQQKIANENIKRSREGLAPIDASQYGLVPTAQVNAAIDPGTQQFMTYLLLGGAALVLIMMMKK